MRLVILILALAMMVLSLWQTPAKAQSCPNNLPPAPAGEFAFFVRNNSGQTAWVAIISHKTPSDDQFHVQGWWKSDAGCTFVGYFPQGNFYYFAYAMKGNNEVDWSGTMLQCVVFQVFDRPDVGDVACDSNSMRSFSEYGVTTNEFTWILSP